MQNVIDILKSQLDDQVVNQLSKDIGAPKDQTVKAIDGVIAALMTGINKNASDNNGMASLMSALDRDHDGSILNDVMGFLNTKGNNQSGALNGAGILKHVLGGNQNQMVDAVSKVSGMDKAKVMTLFISLAPLVMGALGKANKQTGGSNAGGGLMDILMSATKAMNSGNKGGGGMADILGSLLGGQQSPQPTASKSKKPTTNTGNDMLGKAVKGLFDRFLKGK